MRRTWQVENTWSCTACAAVNRGRDLNCRNCGARKGRQVWDNPVDPDAPEVTDPELLRKATAGPNWACPYCGGQERNLAGDCTECGGPKAQARSGDLAVEQAPRPDRRPDPLWRRRLIGPLRGWHVGVLLGSVGALVWIVVWLCTPRTVHAQVSDVSWQYTVNLRARQQLHDGGDWGRPGGRGFYAEPAFNVTCESRYYDDEDCNPHACRPHQESYQCNPVSYECDCSKSCTPNRNGFSTCSESCGTCTRYSTCYRTVYDTCYDRCPIYRDWCSYDYFDWPVRAQKQAGGHDHQMQWPELHPDGDLQRIQKIEQYQVEFRGDGEVFDYAPPTLPDYTRFDVGGRWRLRVGKVRGKIESLEPQE